MFEKANGQARKSLIPISLIGELIPLLPSGKDYRGSCPFHDEESKSLSLYVSEDIQQFKCFGCGISGDIIDFLSRYYAKPRLEAEQLAKRLAESVTAYLPPAVEAKSIVQDVWLVLTCKAPVEDQQIAEYPQFVLGQDLFTPEPTTIALRLGLRSVDEYIDFAMSLEAEVCILTPRFDCTANFVADIVRRFIGQHQIPYIKVLESSIETVDSSLIGKISKEATDPFTSLYQCERELGNISDLNWREKMLDALLSLTLCISDINKVRLDSCLAKISELLPWFERTTIIERRNKLLTAVITADQATFTAYTDDQKAGRVPLYGEVPIREFDQVFSLDNMRLAWRKIYKYAKNTEAYYDCITYERYNKRADEYLMVLQHKIMEDRDYKPAPFHLLNVSREGGTEEKPKVRPIVRIELEDQVVIQSIMNVIAPRAQLSFYEHSYGHYLSESFASGDDIFAPWSIAYYHKYYGALQRILRAPNDFFYLKADLTTFYENIDRQRLLSGRGGINSLVRDGEILRIIHYFLNYRIWDANGGIIETEKGLPQGPAYAHFLANLYLNEFDLWIIHEVTKWADSYKNPYEDLKRQLQIIDPEAYDPTKVRYIRYVDDMFVLFPSEEEAVAGQQAMEAYLREMGLEFSPYPKTGIYSVTETKPVVDEMKRRRYLLGKALENEELTLQQQEVLFQIIDEDIFHLKEPSVSAVEVVEWVKLAVHRLEGSQVFSEDEETYIWLIMQLLFSESLKYIYNESIFEVLLPRLIGDGYEKIFLKNIGQSEPYKKIIFLSTVQTHRLYDKLPPSVQAFILDCLRDENYLVRYAAVNCLVDNCISTSVKQIKQAFEDEPVRAIAHRYLSLFAYTSDSESFPLILPAIFAQGTSAITELCWVLDEIDLYNAYNLLNPLSNNRLTVECFVDLLYLVIHLASPDAFALLNAIVAQNTAEEDLLERLLRSILSKVYSLYEHERRATDSRRYLSLISIINMLLKNASITNLKFRAIIRNEVAQRISATLMTSSEVESEHRDEIMKAARQATTERGENLLLNMFTQESRYKPLNTDFLHSGELRVHSFHDLEENARLIYESLPTSLLVSSKEKAQDQADKSVQKLLAALRSIEDLSCIEDCDVTRGEDGIERVFVLYKYPESYQSIADRLTSSVFEEKAIAQVLADLHEVILSLSVKGLVELKPMSHTVLVNTSGVIKIIGLLRCLLPPKYVSVRQRSLADETATWLSLFMGWLAFEMATGLCPREELSRISRQNPSNRRYLTFSESLSKTSSLFQRLLRRMTYEHSEHRFKIPNDPSFVRNIEKYRLAITQLEHMKADGLPDRILVAFELLSYLDHRVSDIAYVMQSQSAHVTTMASRILRQIFDELDHIQTVRKINFMGFLSWVPALPSYQITFPDDLLISTKNALDYAEAFRNLAAFVAYKANVVVRNRLPQVFLYSALRAEVAALVRATFFSITDTEQRNEAKSELVNNKGKPCESLSVFGVTTPLSQVWLKPSYLDDLFNALSPYDEASDCLLPRVDIGTLVLLPLLIDEKASFELQQRGQISSLAWDSSPDTISVLAIEIPDLEQRLGKAIKEGLSSAASDVASLQNELASCLMRIKQMNPCVRQIARFDEFWSAFRGKFVRIKDKDGTTIHESDIYCEITLDGGEDQSVHNEGDTVSIDLLNSRVISFSTSLSFIEGVISRGKRFPTISRKEPTNLDDFHELVGELVQIFKNAVENERLWENLWVDGRPLLERKVQNFFGSLLRQWVKPMNIDVSREVETGSGPVDFKFSHGFNCKTHLEVKRSHNHKLRQGLRSQLPAYLRSEQVESGYYIIVDFGKVRNLDTLLLELRQEAASLERELGVRLQLVFVDATPKKSASRLS